MLKKKDVSLQSLVRQTLDEGILLDVAIIALWTGALLPTGLQLCLAFRAGHVSVGAGVDGPRPGANCIKIGLPGKLILRKRKGLWEVTFS